MNSMWEPVIGLEIHIQLSTKSKIFSATSTDYGAEPNTQAGIIDLGFPGVLPVLNKEAVLMAIKFGLAIDANIQNYSLFARKNYFYPDLPKGYQISQHTLPIVTHGHINITLENEEIKRIGITRAHLEEDSGKSYHEDFHGMTGLDFNRAGTPLLEVVSEPDMRSAKEAVSYLKTLHALVRYLQICDGNMQEGSFRCDANVSVRPRCSDQLGTRTELKNINSFRFVERAIDYEIERQINLLAAGGKVIQETRLFDAEKNETRTMRIKEEANDYRYFPEPDLLPLEVTEEMIATVKASLPELPQHKHERFIKDYRISNYMANLLVNDKETADYFEKVIELSRGNPTLIANWMMGELAAAINKSNTNIKQCPINEEHLAKLIERIKDNTISGKIAKTVFESMWNEEGSVDEIIEKKGLKQLTDTSEIERIIEQVISAHSEEANAYRQGKIKLFGFFVGQVMQATNGKANPEQVNKLLKEKLS